MKRLAFFLIAAGFAWWIYNRYFRARSGTEQHLAEQSALSRYGARVNDQQGRAKPVDYLDIFRQGLRGVTAVRGTWDAETVAPSEDIMYAD